MLTNETSPVSTTPPDAEALPASAGPPNRKRPRWRLCAFLVVLLALVGWFGRFAWLRITLKPTPRPEYWAAELRKHFLSPPNGLPCKEVDKVMHIVPPAMCRARPAKEWTKRFTQPPEGMRSLVGEAMIVDSHFEADLDRFARVVNHPWMPLGIDLRIRPCKPWSFVARSWNTLLLGHADWHFQKGRIQKAGSDLLLALKLARHMLDQPDVSLHPDAFEIQKDVGWYILSTASDLHTPLECNAEFIREAEALLGGLLPPERLFFVNRLADMQALEEVYVREGDGWLDVSEVATRQGLGSFLGFRASSFWNLASPLFHSYAAARSAVETHYRELARIENLGTGKRDASIRGRRSILVGGGTLKPATVSLVDKRNLDEVLFPAHVDALTHMEAALAALAVMQCRRLYAKYPDRLEDLVPSILSRIPRDYRGNRALSYRLKPETKHGFVLYTYGYDNKDDGGVRGQATAERDEILFPQAPWRGL